MKTTCLLILATALSALGQPSELTEVSRGAHSRTWQNVRQIETEEGITLVTNSFEELQGGLHRRTEQGWVLTDPKIELFQDGAVVRNLQYGVIFGPNLASPGAIDVELPSSVAFIAWFPNGRLVGSLHRKDDIVSCEATANVVNAIRGSALYQALGYVPKSERKSGLRRIIPLKKAA